jgi:mannose-6-phosphate isomerase-like protein (cupin superfamily)
MKACSCVFAATAVSGCVRLTDALRVSKHLRRAEGGEWRMAFTSKRLSAAPDVIAPDGSEVRVLCATSRASTAVFTLRPGAVARAVRHRTVDEVWYVLSGAGRIWRRLGNEEEITKLSPGVSVTIPAGAEFQFRCDGEVALSVFGATIPPWPGETEAVFTEGPWAAAVDPRN